MAKSPDEKLTASFMLMSGLQEIVGVLAEGRPLDIEKCTSFRDRLGLGGATPHDQKDAPLANARPVIRDAAVKTGVSLLYVTILRSVAELGLQVAALGENMIPSLAKSVQQLSICAKQARIAVAAAQGDFLRATNVPVSYAGCSGTTWHDVAVKIAERLLESIWRLNPCLFANALSPGLSVIPDPKPLEMNWDTVCGALRELPFTPSDGRNLQDRLIAEAINAAELAKALPTTPAAKRGRGEGDRGKEERFRVALSFPGEHREFLAQVANSLANGLGRERVFYDKYYEAELARPDLDTYLQRIYHDDSDLIAVFLCADYDKKEWCGLELRVIRDLIKKRSSAAIMPFRFDDTSIPGLFSIDGYIDIGQRSPNDVASLILERLQHNDQ